MIRFILALWDGTITCGEHIMTITQSDKKYFAGGINPYDENVFGMIVEAIGTLNLNISGRSNRRKQCLDEQE